LRQKADTAAQHLIRGFERFIPRVAPVIRQTVRRVLDGESVPARDKLVSVFEPHTAIIRRGKWNTSVEFGRVIWLDEVDGGIISRVAILPGNPSDAEQFQPSLDHHHMLFARSPSLVTADRKVFSPQNEAYARQQGVPYTVLPKPGKKSLARQTHENQPWFRSGRNWRAGLEAPISQLKRRFGLRRCRYHDEDGLHRWVGWGVITYNLWTIAHKIAA
jgi:IS5 family transposase